MVDPETTKLIVTTFFGLAAGAVGGVLTAFSTTWSNHYITKLKGKLASRLEDEKGGIKERLEKQKAEWTAELADARAETEASLLRFELDTRPTVELRAKKFGELATRITAQTSVLIPAFRGLSTNQSDVDDALLELWTIGAAESCWLPKEARLPLLRFAGDARELANRRDAKGKANITEQEQKDIGEKAEAIAVALRRYIWNDESEVIPEEAGVAVSSVEHHES